MANNLDCGKDKLLFLLTRALFNCVTTTNSEQEKNLKNLLKDSNKISQKLAS